MDHKKFLDIANKLPKKYRNVYDWWLLYSRGSIPGRVPSEFKMMLSELADKGLLVRGSKKRRTHSGKQISFFYKLATPIEILQNKKIDSD